METKKLNSAAFCKRCFQIKFTAMIYGFQWYLIINVLQVKDSKTF